MKVKQQTALEKVQNICDRLMTKWSFKKIVHFDLDLQAKQLAVERLRPGFSYRNSFRAKLDKRDALKQWIEAYHFKAKSEQLNLRANRFRALNQ